MENKQMTSNKALNQTRSESTPVNLVVRRRQYHCWLAQQSNLLAAPGQPLRTAPNVTSAIARRGPSAPLERRA
jgi:hypothetical protein